MSSALSTAVSVLVINFISLPQKNKELFVTTQVHLHHYHEKRHELKKRTRKKIDEKRDTDKKH